MKKNILRKFSLVTMLVASLLFVFSPPALALSNSAYLTPASGTSQVGSKFTVSVDGTVQAAFYYWWVYYSTTTSVSGTMSFPANLVKVTGIDKSGATFSDNTNNVTYDNNAGTISFQQANSSNGASDQVVHLFRVEFQSIASGSAAVNFGSVNYNTGAAATSNGSYVINPAPPTPAPPTPTPTPTPKPTTKPKTPVATPTPTPTPVPTQENIPAPVTESDGGLKIENVKVAATRSENSVTWSLSNASAKPSFLYGTQKNTVQEVDATTITQLPDGSYQMSLEDLKLGTLYYFTIKAATDDNLQGATYSGVLTTRGYPVQLTVEQNNLLIAGAKVKIGGRSFVANKEGVITTELSDGEFTAAISAPNESTAHETKFTVKKLAVVSGSNPDTQSFVLNVTVAESSTAATSNSLLPTIIGGALVVAALGIASVIGFLIYKKRKTSQPTQTLDIDTNHIKETYGGAVEQYMTNTPEPNLGGSFNNPIVMENTQRQEQPIPQQQIVPQEPATAAVDLATQQVAQDTAQQSDQTFDPVVLPLPPATTTPAQDLASQPVEPVADTPAIAQQIESYSDQPVSSVADDNDALSQAVTQVESSEQIVDDEPTALYDAATGELDIIHHHANPPGPMTTQPPQGAPS